MNVNMDSSLIATVHKRLGSAFNVTRVPLLCQLGELVMMSFAPAKSGRVAGYVSQDPFIQSMLSQAILTPFCSVFFPRQIQN